jgi:hypothetical protein
MTNTAEEYVASIAHLVQDQPEPEFRTIVERVTGESPLTYAYSLRMAVDPEEEFAHTASLVYEIVLALIEYDLDFSDELSQWIDDCRHSVRLIDAALTDPLRLDDPNNDPYEYEPNINADPSTFDAGYDRRDAWGKGNKNFNAVFVSSANPLGKTSRDMWKRTTKNDTSDLYVLCDYGNFSLDQTKKYHESLFKVKTNIRRVSGVATPFLSVGCIQINMRNGIAECGLSGCTMKTQLLHAPVDSPVGVENDREYQEYQILKILEHLGTHDKNGWLGKITEVKRYRDSDDNKWLSRSINLNRKVRA